MQEEIRCRTQEALCVPDWSERMTLSELGHIRGIDPGHGVGSGGLRSTGKDQVGQRDLSTNTQGVLSSIVLRGGESPLQGEGLDGST